MVMKKKISRVKNSNVNKTKRLTTKASAPKLARKTRKTGTKRIAKK
jgi:hypothetical protein